jgi:acyl-CoA thioesterase FadM
VADASSVLVIFDYHSGKPHPIPGALRQAAAEMEKRDFLAS